MWDTENYDFENIDVYSDKISRFFAQLRIGSKRNVRTKDSVFPKKKQIGCAITFRMKLRCFTDSKQNYVFEKNQLTSTLKFFGCKKHLTTGKTTFVPDWYVFVSAISNRFFFGPWFQDIRLLIHKTYKLPKNPDLEVSFVESEKTNLVNRSIW